MGKLHLGLRLCLVLLPAVLFMSCAKNDAFAELQEISAQMNKTCPLTIDSGTRLDSTGAKETPLSIVYYYTATTANKDALPDNFEEVKQQLKEVSQKNLDTEPAMEVFRKQGVALTYNYKDKNGQYIFEYTVTAKK
jgi:hypothetical protein